MGGALAVHIAAKKVLPSLAGLVVVDVVEVGLNTYISFMMLKYLFMWTVSCIKFQGTAMASLIHMQKILSNRMQHFSSIEKAVIHYFVNLGVSNFCCTSYPVDSSSTVNFFSNSLKLSFGNADYAYMLLDWMEYQRRVFEKHWFCSYLYTQHINLWWFKKVVSRIASFLFSLLFSLPWLVL